MVVDEPYGIRLLLWSIAAHLSHDILDWNIGAHGSILIRHLFRILHVSGLHNMRDLGPELTV